jgi:bifunctional non-homologous end joining protein LigD
MHARIDGGRVALLTRTGIDRSAKYPATVLALRELKIWQAYLDGEFCAAGPDGVPSFAALQVATDAETTGELVYFVFDPLHLDGADLRALPRSARKQRLAKVTASAPASLQLSEDMPGNGALFLAHARKLGLEGAVSKRIDKPYMPGEKSDLILMAAGMGESPPPPHRISSI